MLFEMLTGDFLFEPRKGPEFSKNEDHLAQMQELIGNIYNNIYKQFKNTKINFLNNIKKIFTLNIYKKF